MAECLFFVNLQSRDVTTLGHYGIYPFISAVVQIVSVFVSNFWCLMEVACSIYLPGTTTGGQCLATRVSVLHSLMGLNHEGRRQGMFFLVQPVDGECYWRLTGGSTLGMEGTYHISTRLTLQL